MKICVIDDEREVRISIIQKITSLFPQEEIFDVGFGRRALEQIKLVQPNLIFLDIRMPEISGLEILSELKQSYPQMHVIIISGYDDFEYARKALQYGAMDYLLKPADRMQLKELIEKVQQNLNQQFYSDLEFYRSKAAHLSWTMKDIDFQLYNTSLWFDERIWKQIIFGNRSGLVENVREPNHILCTFSVNSSLEGMIAVSNQQTSPGAFREKASFITEFEKELKQKVEARFYQVHKASLLQRNKVDLHELHKKIANIRQAILTQARIGDNQKLEQSLKEWFKYLADLSYEELKKECAHLLALLDEGLSKNELIFIEEEVLHYWLEWATKYDTWSELKQRIETMVLSGVKAIKNLDEEQQDKTKTNQWFKQALHMIENSDDLNLSLDSVADSVNVHPVTLSRMFKQQMGMNFVRYLTQKRLEHAKHLLLTTDKKINEVAEEVGYADYPYFRNLFKKEYTYSPSEFRRKHGIASTD